MTATLTHQEQTYQALRSAMLRAQKAGMRIVCESNEVTVRAGYVVGVCAVAATRLYGTAKERRLLRDTMAIARGFDGLNGGGLYYDIGARLRDEFQPITATALERELEGT